MLIHVNHRFLACITDDATRDRSNAPYVAERAVRFQRFHMKIVT